MTLRNLLIPTVLLAAIWIDTPEGVSPPQASWCDSSDLLVRNASVWTPSGVLANRDVLFSGGRVAAVEPTRSRAGGSIRVIDGTGHTLLPGLIDSHLHFSIPGGLPPGDRPRTDAEEITARQLLRSGVTAGRLHLATVDEAVQAEGALGRSMLASAVAASGWTWLERSQRA